MRARPSVAAEAQGGRSDVRSEHAEPVRDRRRGRDGLLAELGADDAGAGRAGMPGGDARREGDAAGPPQRDPFWLAEARSAWPGASPPAGSKVLTAALLTRGPRSISKVIALVFAPGEYAPRVIVKLPRVPESDPGLAREATVLREVGGRVPGIPRLLFHIVHEGVRAVGQEAIEATPNASRNACCGTGKRRIICDTTIVGTSNGSTTIIGSGAACS